MSEDWRKQIESDYRMPAGEVRQQALLRDVALILVEVLDELRKPPALPGAQFAAGGTAGGQRKFGVL